MKINDALCNLPDSEFKLGGEFDRIARENGYPSGRAAANDLNLWGLSVRDAIHSMAVNAENQNP